MPKHPADRRRPARGNVVAPPAVIPVPASIWLLLSGVAALRAIRRRA
ncbi:MAG: VPLPA-CTERM sorting domain-containing protein [Gammaproteobacteria bacterium]|nr:VPLPA-CTERM sorting domain-containing protein [Gammaproteobacteria bacterium]